MQPSPKRYLVVSEYNFNGYIIGYYDTIEETEKVLEELHSHNDPYSKPKQVHLYEQTMNYPSYRIHLTCSHFMDNCLRGNTDGQYDTHVFDTHLVYNFTIEKFVFERGNTVYAYEFDQYENIPRTFVDSALNIIAN